MAKARASKGLLVGPVATPNISAEQRQAWLDNASAKFVSPSTANKEYYRVILEALWPEEHGIPGPHLSESDIRAAVNAFRAREGKDAYKDVFRRLRELQGEEGFVCIIKEGVRYQLKDLAVGPKREPRAKPSPKLWRSILDKYDHHCAHCGAQEPDVKLSPDHRVPRARGGGNEDGNWQPLCEQCNNIKSSACQGCQMNCYVCHWAFPETYKPLLVDDDNRELIKRVAEKSGRDHSEVMNEILRKYFNRN